MDNLKALFIPVKIQLFIAYLAENTTCQTYELISTTAVTTENRYVCHVAAATIPLPPPQEQQHDQYIMN